RTRRDAVVAGAATVFTLAAHTAFRFGYYGALLPNTYYLKVEGHPFSERFGRGLEALTDLLSSSLWAPAALAVALLAIRRRSLARGEELLVALVLPTFASSVYVGGDAWEWAGYANRYVSVTLPLLGVLAVLGIDALLQASIASALPAYALLGACAALGL